VSAAISSAHLDSPERHFPMSRAPPWWLVVVAQQYPAAPADPRPSFLWPLYETAAEPRILRVEWVPRPTRRQHAKSAISSFKPRQDRCRTCREVGMFAVLFQRPASSAKLSAPTPRLRAPPDTWSRSLVVSAARIASLLSFEGRWRPPDHVALEKSARRARLSSVACPGWPPGERAVHPP